MALAPGTRLGPYEILAPIGSGGKSEKVYRARDPRLGRDVAIRVLPPEVARDETPSITTDSDRPPLALARRVSPTYAVTSAASATPWRRAPTRPDSGP